MNFQRCIVRHSVIVDYLFVVVAVDLVLELGALCLMERAFPQSQVLSLAVTRQVYTAAVVMYCAAGSWSEACFYHLKSLIQCQGHLGNQYTSQVSHCGRGEIFRIPCYRYT